MAIGFQLPTYGWVDVGAAPTKYPWLDDNDIKALEESKKNMSTSMTDTQLYQQALRTKNLKVQQDMKTTAKNNAAYQAETKNDPVLKAKVKMADINDSIAERGRALAQSKWVDDTQYTDQDLVGKFIWKYWQETYNKILNDQQPLDEVLPQTSLGTKLKWEWQWLKQWLAESKALWTAEQAAYEKEHGLSWESFTQQWPSNVGLYQVWDIAKFISNSAWDVLATAADKLIPWFIKRWAKETSKAFLSTNFGKEVSEMWLYRLSQGVDAYNDWKELNPYDAKKLESVFNIWMVVADAVWAGEVAQLWTKLATTGVKTWLKKLWKTTVGKEIATIAWETAGWLEQRAAGKEFQEAFEHIKPKLTGKQQQNIAMAEWFKIEWILWEKEITMWAKAPWTSYTLWDIAAETKWLTKWTSPIEDMSSVQRGIDLEMKTTEWLADRVDINPEDIAERLSETKIPLKVVWKAEQVAKANIDDIMMQSVQEASDAGKSLLEAKRLFDSKIKTRYGDVFKDTMPVMHEYIQTIRKIPDELIVRDLGSKGWQTYLKSLERQSKLIEGKKLLATKVPAKEFYRVIGKAYSWLNNHPIIAMWAMSWVWRWSAIAATVTNPIVWAWAWLAYWGTKLWKLLRSPEFDKSLAKALRWLEEKLMVNPWNSTLKEWKEILWTLQGIIKWWWEMTNPNTAGIPEKPFKEAAGTATTTPKAVTETTLVWWKAVSDTPVSSKTMAYINQAQSTNMSPMEFIKQEGIKFNNTKNLDTKKTIKWKRYTVEVWWRLHSQSMDWWNTRNQTLYLNKKYSPTSAEWKEVLRHEIWHYLDNVTTHHWRFTDAMWVWWLSAKYEPMIRDNFEYLAPEKFQQVKKWEMSLEYAGQPVEILAEWHKKYMRDPITMKKEKPELAAMYEELQSKYPVFQRLLWKKWPTASLDTILSASEPYNYIVDAVNKWKKLSHTKWIIIAQTQIESSTFTINDLKNFYAKSKESMYPWFEYTVSTTPHWWDQTTLFLIRLKWHAPIK